MSFINQIRSRFGISLLVTFLGLIGSSVAHADGCDAPTAKKCEALCNSRPKCSKVCREQCGFLQAAVTQYRSDMALSSITASASTEQDEISNFISSCQVACDQQKGKNDQQKADCKTSMCTVELAKEIIDAIKSEERNPASSGFGTPEKMHKKKNSKDEPKAKSKEKEKH